MARPPLGSIYIYFIVALLGYMLADLTILNFRDLLIPRQPPPDRPRQAQTIAQVPRQKYDIITGKNIFNIDGKIPDPIGAKAQDKNQSDDLPPERTSIPGLVLIGTLVHSNPAKSVASVKTASSGENVGAFRVSDTIEGVGEVLAIERGKVIFRNLVSQRKEYVELPQEGKINLGLSQNTSSQPKQVGEVTVLNDFDRTLKRDDVNRLTNNLPDLLQQARAVQDGACFKMLDIQPGSLYERLGIKRGDNICSVNGEKIDSPQKAMEMYNALKNSSQISLGIERGGRPETLNYTIQ